MLACLLVLCNGVRLCSDHHDAWIPSSFDTRTPGLGVALGCGHHWPGEYIGVLEIIRGNGCRALSRCIEKIARPGCVPCNTVLLLMLLLALRSLVRLQKPHF
jgi:hypothetical protein